MARSKQSKKWLKEHFDDIYVQQAQKDGFRSRAIYKLEEIDQRDRLIKPGMTIVDLGAAPGGWSQYASLKMKGNGRVLALDILPMDSLADVEFFQGDFTEDVVYQQVLDSLGETKSDLVMSDMAPNISGMKAVDQPKAMYLAELALDLAKNILKNNGVYLTKVFQGEGFDDYFREIKTHFTKVVVRKPKASRPRSREVYLLASGYKGKL
ncbi:MAG: 23S rRNA (uridine(2552)-2'-O)-methyltransferase RlmE [Gammaproteobacteria bacterium]|nr:23S rRNA (uridine(2552)-2'-O)-methyltransferase RlmE [Gammaproteobacteria bacterium]